MGRGRWWAGAAVAVAAAVVTGAVLGSSLRTTPSQDGPWRRDGARVGADVISVIRGPRHCDWQSSQWLRIVWPLDAAGGGSAGRRTYVRDPLGVLAGSGGRIEAFRADVDLPPDAGWSGYRTDHYELWLAHSDADRAVYLVRSDAVERWPRASDDLACG